MWTQTGAHRFPGDPSHAFALLQDPGRATRTSPWRSWRCCPRATHAEGLRTQTYIEANTRLWHLLSTLHERRCRRPCKTRFRLAGCAFAGRASNPLDRFERFQGLHSILLSRAFPVARVEKFNKLGPEGLIDRKAPGKPPLLNVEHRKALVAIIESGSTPAIHGVVRWRIIDLCRWLFAEFRVSVAAEMDKIRSSLPPGTPIEIWWADEARIG